MDSIPAEEQKIEIQKSLSYLKSIGSPIKNWILCYPYGKNNTSLHNILKEYGCGAALIASGNIENIRADSKYQLPRIPTNLLPVTSDAQPNNLTMNA